jgi:type I restriction enzyme M protein
MALKKSQLYSSLWSGCDELRDGMDASQYKDYVLTLLFMKYVSDKYAGKQDAIMEVPEGGSFVDMVSLKGGKEIGDKINKIIGRLAEGDDLPGDAYEYLMRRFATESGKGQLCTPAEVSRIMARPREME